MLITQLKGQSQQRFQRWCRSGRGGESLGGDGRTTVVARCAVKRNSSALAGIWRLKSTRLCTRKALHPRSPARLSEAAKDLSLWRIWRREIKKSAPRNQAQQIPPAIP